MLHNSSNIITFSIAIPSNDPLDAVPEIPHSWERWTPGRKAIVVKAVRGGWDTKRHAEIRTAQAVGNNLDEIATLAKRAGTIWTDCRDRQEVRRLLSLLIAHAEQVERLFADDPEACKATIAEGEAEPDRHPGGPAIEDIDTNERE